MNEQDPTTRFPNVAEPQHRVSSPAPQPQPWPTKPRRQHRTRTVVLWAIATFVLGLLLGNVPTTPSSPAVSAPSIGAATTVPTASPAPSGPRTTFTDGTYEVGPDVAPGRYKTTGEDTGLLCIWSVKSSAGDVGALGSGKGPQVVNLRAGRLVTTNGCGQWVKS